MVICIGREFGSGGHEIGARLAKEMQLHFYDGELVTLPGQMSGLDEERLRQADETRVSALLHRFEECRKEISDPEEAMADALCKSTSSILSSRLTTVIGFLALVLMRFQIGPDLGLALVEEVRAIAENYYPDAYYLTGEAVGTYDLMDTIQSDMVKVNLVAIAAACFRC